MTESMGKWCAEKGQLEVVRQRVDDFAKERDWEKYHTPRNLVLAFVGEVGELAELFQWHDDSAGPFNVQTAFDTEQKKDHLRDELADCALYLIRLADRCDVDLGDAIDKKIAKNAIKYPAFRVRGSSKKYNEYDAHNERDTRR